ncbi:MAG: hypothetical protein QM813_26980 [Verrucomicrobiota bacterium]
MQTTKFLVVIELAATVWVSPLQSFAGTDTEAQAKLREALRQKMETLETTAAPAPAPAAKSAAPAPKVEVAKPAAPTPTVVVPVPVEAVAATPVVATAAKADSKFSEVPTTSEDAATAKMREAMRQKLAEPVAAPTTPAPAVVAAPAKPVAPAAAVVAPAPAPAATSVVASHPAEPVVAPAFSGTKQDRLAALLMQYKADLITPQQYHTQRAAIIAEP